ncbi:MAG: hypothetical protein AAFR61_26605 [Bacteroidota bacterium]
MAFIPLFPRLSDQVLAEAEPLSVDSFFQRRMNNRKMEKVKGRRCEILTDDGNFFYVGYPFGPNEAPQLERLYKVDREELLKRFPAYESLEGYHFKERIARLFTDPANKSYSGYTLLAEDRSFTFHLEKDHIKVICQCKQTRDLLFKRKRTLKCLFGKDKDTLLHHEVLPN